MDNKIIDRKLESKQILELIEEKKYNVFFLYSKTGVGKSTLTKKLSNILSTEKIIIITRTIPDNRGSKDNEGEFISKIFNSFLKEMYKKKLRKQTFDYYLKKNKNIKKKSIEKIINGIDDSNTSISFGLNVSKYFISKIFKIFEYNQNAYIVLKDKESLLVACDYIKYVLSFGNVFWSVDNFQNIDLYSQQLIQEIISIQPQNNVTIFEYTISLDEDYYRLVQINSLYNQIGIDSILFPLQNMDTSYIFDILKNINFVLNTDNTFYYDAQQYYLNESNGNLYKLIEFKMTYNESNDYDPIIKKILTFTNDQKYIISIIALVGGQINKIQLDNIILFSEDIHIFNYKEQYFDLIYTHNFIKEENGLVYFSHASILDIFKKQNTFINIQMLLAFRNIEKYYLTKIESEFTNFNEKFQAILLLIDLNYIYNPKEIMKYFYLIIPYTYEKISPNSLMKYIIKYLNCIDIEFDHNINNVYFIIQFCFNYCLYQECLHVISILKSKSKNYVKYLVNIYEMNALEYLEKHEEVIKKCESLITENISDKEKYLYYLILIGSYRSLNKKDMSLYYANKIKKIVNYKSYKEYGIYLRLKETYMSRSMALPYLKKSVDFFVEKKDLFNEIKSRITYSFLIAVTQDIELSRIELNKAIKKSKKYNLFNIVFLINQSTLDILDNKFSLEIEKNLQQAELSTSSPYDKLLIATLRLINAFECNHSSIINYLLAIITEMIQYEADKHLLAVVTYNLYIYNSLNKNETEKYKYYNLAKKYENYNTSVKYKLKNKTNKKTPTLFNTKWAVAFTFFGI